MYPSGWYRVQNSEFVSSLTVSTSKTEEKYRLEYGKNNIYPNATRLHPTAKRGLHELFASLVLFVGFIRT